MHILNPAFVDYSSICSICGPMISIACSKEEDVGFSWAWNRTVSCHSIMRLWRKRKDGDEAVTECILDGGDEAKFYLDPL